MLCVLLSSNGHREILGTAFVQLSVNVILTAVENGITWKAQISSLMPVLYPYLHDILGSHAIFVPSFARTISWTLWSVRCLLEIKRIAMVRAVLCVITVVLRFETIVCSTYSSLTTLEVIREQYINIFTYKNKHLSFIFQLKWAFPLYWNSLT